MQMNKMKNKISRRQFLQVAGASAAALLLASCSGNSASSVSSSPVASSEAASTVVTTGKTLVVYFSATGTTQGVAQTIADTVGADLFEVVPSDPYTSDDLTWTNNDSRVSREHNNEDLRAVALENTDVDGWDAYDTVFTATPSGGASPQTLPKSLRLFLDNPSIFRYDRVRSNAGRNVL